MKLKFALYLIILVSVFIGCKDEVRKKSSLNKEQITNEVLEMFDSYHNAIKANGLEAEFDYLDNSSDFYWVPPGYASALSYDEVKAILIKNSKSIKTISFSFETIQVFPLTDTIANYSGIVFGKMKDTSNIDSNFKIIESGTLIKRKDGWKLLSGQSRNLP